MIGLDSVLGVSPRIAADAVPPLEIVVPYAVIVFFIMVGLEFAVMLRFYPWSRRYTFVTSLLANASSLAVCAVGLLFVSTSGLADVDLAGVGVAVWEPERFWALNGAVSLLACYIVTALVETSILHGRAIRADKSSPYRHALKTAALMNLATFAVAAPFWILGSRPYIPEKILDDAQARPAAQEAALSDTATSSGEIMVLDIEARKFASLFPGHSPVALSSLTAENAEAAQENRTEE